MRVLQVALIVLVGTGPHSLAAVDAGGVLAAIALPKAYYDLFGPPGRATALALAGLLVSNLSVVVLVATGYFAGSRHFPQLTEAYPRGVVFGMLAPFGAWLAASEAGLESFSLVPCWTLPGLLAPWSGVALGASRVARS